MVSNVFSCLETWWNPRTRFWNSTWNTERHFGRNQVLINAHMESLSNISAPSADVQQLRKFYDSCESNIRALETLGVQTDSYGSLLIPILLKKLPGQLRCTIFRTNPQADCSLNDLRKALCPKIDTREKSQLTQESDTSSVVDDVLVPTHSTASNTPATEKLQYERDIWAKIMRILRR